jgi:hypothetical protein
MINIFRTFNRDFTRTMKGKAVNYHFSAIENGDTYENVANLSHLIIVILLTNTFPNQKYHPY